MLSLDKFVALVERSELVEADQLSQAVADWKSRATIRALSDAHYCADYLVEAGLLTQWQSRKLLEGRHRGFLLGKYKLLDHLGSGGMSSVYLAEHVLMQRRVAIKVLPHNRVGDSTYLARFHFEAQAAATLDHRNIVRVYDLDNAGKIHYLVMEYIEGRDLDAIVAEDGPLDYHAAANVVAQAASGLEHAHQRSLVHRDIKPANLLVDLKGTVKILDMGLAKFTGETRRNPGFAQDEQVLGTADYLAPEQSVNSHTVDQRADIYALGCTLYFLLTGHAPFVEGTSLERMTAHQQQVPPSLLLDRPDAPAALVAICRRMMEKSPANRFQSASVVASALNEWIESERASGKVVTTGLSLVRQGSSGTRNQARSKANLVSGSTSDLYRMPPDSPPLSSSLGETDANLNRATVKMSPGVPPSTRSPGDDVFPAGEGQVVESDRPSRIEQLAPPIVAPPRETLIAAQDASQERGFASSGAARETLPPIRTPSAARWAVERARLNASGEHWRRWTGAIVLSALVLLAIAAMTIVISR